LPTNLEELNEYEQQIEQYKQEIDTWQVDYSQWKEERESAIGEGEGVISQFHKNYGSAFGVNVGKTWAILGGLAMIFCLSIIPIQKRKNIV